MQRHFKVPTLAKDLKVEKKPDSTVTASDTAPTTDDNTASPKPGDLISLTEGDNFWTVLQPTGPQRPMTYMKTVELSAEKELKTCGIGNR